MPRICFVLQVRPNRLKEYRDRHRDVWPAMQHALRDTGWKDYSLFLREDGLLVGYLLSDDFQNSRDAMRAFEVNAQWQKEMAPFFLDGAQADLAMQPLEEVFHLD